MLRLLHTLKRDVREPGRFEKSAVERSLRFQTAWLLMEAFDALLFQGLRWVKLLPLSGVWFVPPIGIAAGVRVICLALARRPLRRFTHALAALCLLLDVALLTTCHPEVSHAMPWGAHYWIEPPPHPPPMESLDDRKASMGRHAERPPSPAPKGSPGSGQPPPQHSGESPDFTDDQARAEFMAVQQEYSRLSQEYDAVRATWEMEILALSEQYLYDHMVVVTGLLVLLSYMMTFVLPFRWGAYTLPLGFVPYCLAVVLNVVRREGGDGPLHAPTSKHIVQRTVMELCILACGILVFLAATWRSEQTLHENCRLLDEQRGEIIQEKVLRCKAEFAQERLIAGLVRRAPSCPDSTTEPQPAPAPGAAGQPTALMKQAKVQPSLRSAPPATRSFLEASLGSGARNRGDCLPPGVAVWVEGQPLPTEIAKVSVGQRVLCYDTVGHCQKFVEVTESRVLTGEVPWVKVSMADGTEMISTANHPMQPKRLDQACQPALSSPVSAKDLRPGVDSLMVLKLVPVPVASVSSSKAETGERRVALLVRQPERHDVFVAPAGTEPQAATVAVGSADVDVVPEGREIAFAPVVKRTFIDFEPMQQHGRGRRRCSSLPPRLGPHADGQGLEPRELGGELAAPAPAAPPRAPGSASGGSWGYSGDSSLTSSRSGEGGAQILLSVYEQQPDGPVQLSDVCRARSLGLPSVGSMGHGAGDCRVCVFQNRFHSQGRDPCWKGLACNRCHEPHEPTNKKKKHKPGSLRRYLKSVAAGREEPEEP